MLARLVRADCLCRHNGIRSHTPSLKERQLDGHQYVPPTLFITPQKCKANEAWCFQQLAITVLPYLLEVMGILWLDLYWQVQISCRSRLQLDNSADH